MGLTASVRPSKNLDVEVVVIDKHTAATLGRAEPDHEPTAPPAELLKAQEKDPDGPAAIPRERLIWPWLMALLGIAGLVIVGGAMYARGGWNAAVVGVVWLTMGYAVSWIVVWMAGVLRAREERDLEAQIEQRHKEEGNA